MTEEKKISRRTYLGAAAGIAAGAAAASAATWYLTRAPTPPQKIVTLRNMISVTYPAYVDAQYTLASRYASEVDPNVRISPDAASWDETVVKVEKAHAAGVDYDVGDLGGTANFWHLAQIDDFKYFMDLSDLLDEMGGADYFFEKYLATCYYPGTGEYLGLPWFNNSMTMWYRRDWVEENGLKEPRTWSDYKALCETVMDPDAGVYGTLLPLKPSYYLSAFPWSIMMGNGGGIIGKGGKVIYDSKENVEALEFLRELWDFCPPGCAEYDAGELRMVFVNGGTATSWYSRLILTQDVDQYAPELHDNVDIVPVPTRTTGQTPRCRDTVEHACVFRGTAYPEEAKAWTKWFLQPEQMILMDEVWPAQCTPTIAAVYEDPGFWEHPVRSRWRELYTKYMEIGRQYSVTAPFESGEFDVGTALVLSAHYVSQSLQDLCLNNMDPEDVATKWAGKMRELLGRE